MEVYLGVGCVFGYFGAMIGAFLGIFVRNTKGASKATIVRCAKIGFVLGFLCGVFYITCLPQY